MFTVLSGINKISLQFDTNAKMEFVLKVLLGAILEKAAETIFYEQNNLLVWFGFLFLH